MLHSTEFLFTDLRGLSEGGAISRLDYIHSLEAGLAQLAVTRPKSR